MEGLKGREAPTLMLQGWKLWIKISPSDHGGNAKCNPEVTGGAYFMGSIMAVTGIMATILVISGIFHSGLRRLGQPSIISHILAGIIVGPTMLGRVMDLRQLGMRDAGSALSSTIYYIRIVFMFFIGLELDLLYLRRNLRRSLAVACGSSVLCLVLAALFGPFFFGLLHPDHHPFHPDTIYTSTALFMLVLASTASPVLIRVVTEMKLTGSETGQLAIGAAFLNDMAVIAALSLVSISRSVVTGSVTGKTKLPTSSSSQPEAGTAVVLVRVALMVWAATSATTWAARRLNRVKRGRQHVSMYELCGMLLLIVGLSMLAQAVGYSASMTGFLIGLAMPREGPTARTIRDRLAYPVHELIMPLCFAAVGARLDFAPWTGGRFTAAQLAAVVAFTTLLSAVGKVAGAALVGRMALGVAPREAVLLGALLNVKGYTDVLVINLGDRTGVWGDTAQAVLLLSSVVNTVAVGPASAALARAQRCALRYRARCLQDMRADHELRVLVCVHGVVDVHPMLTLAYLASRTAGAPLAVHLLHLVELVTARKYAITSQLYSAGRSEDDDDEWGYPRDVERVAAAVACFTYDHAVPVRQVTAISTIASMDADVLNGVDDARASIVLVPFHKELRYDGRMVCRRKGRRQLNQRILARAPCTVGIFVERRFIEPVVPGGAEQQAVVQQVAAVFLGGADDREAVEFAARLAGHPWVSVTVCRLRPAPGFPIVAGEETALDDAFMADLHSRFVAPEKLSYTERYVSNGAETVNALGSMAREFAVFVVGKASGGGAGTEAMTCGMGDWDDDCPELGPIGELLASDDVAGACSVLVLQHHRVHPSDKMRTWKNASSPAGAPTDDTVVDIYEDPTASVFTSQAK